MGHMNVPGDSVAAENLQWKDLDPTSFGEPGWPHHRVPGSGEHCEKDLS